MFTKLINEKTENLDSELIFLLEKQAKLIQEIKKEKSRIRDIRQNLHHCGVSYKFLLLNQNPTVSFLEYCDTTLEKVTVKKSFLDKNDFSIFTVKFQDHSNSFRVKSSDLSPKVIQILLKKIA